MSHSQKLFVFLYEQILLVILTQFLDDVHDWIVKFITLTYIFLKKLIRNDCLIPEFDGIHEQLFDKLNFRQTKLYKDWVIITGDNFDSHFFYELDSSKFSVYLFHVDTVKHDVLDGSLLIHRHLLNFGRLENVIAFGFI